MLSLDGEMSPKDFSFRITWGHDDDSIHVSETKQERGNQQPGWVEKYALLNSCQQLLSVKEEIFSMTLSVNWIGPKIVHDDNAKF